MERVNNFTGYNLEMYCKQHAKTDQLLRLVQERDGAFQAGEDARQRAFGLIVPVEGAKGAIVPGYDPDRQQEVKRLYATIEQSKIKHVEAIAKIAAINAICERYDLRPSLGWIEKELRRSKALLEKLGTTEERLIARVAATSTDRHPDKKGLRLLEAHQKSFPGAEAKLADKIALLEAAVAEIKAVLSARPPLADTKDEVEDVAAAGG